MTKQEIHECNDVVTLLDLEMQLKFDIDLNIVETRTLGYKKTMSEDIELKKKHYDFIYDKYELERKLNLCRSKLKQIRSTNKYKKMRESHTLIRFLIRDYPEIYNKIKNPPSD